MRWIFLIFASACNALLYPQQNEVRSLESLDGLWTFVREPLFAADLGLKNRWFEEDLDTFENATRMPVPSAFNELSAEHDERTHVGWVWYQRKYSTPWAVSGKRLILRFGSVNYNAFVYINGNLSTVHTGGHLPFELELPITSKGYKITVAVNNTLHAGTIPPGDYELRHYGNSTYVYQKPGFDFFNYAGILRPVVVQVLNHVYLSKLKIWTVKPNILKYILDIDNPKNIRVQVSVSLIDPAGNLVETVLWPKEFKPVEHVQLWWPRGYGKANLYKLKIVISVEVVKLDLYTESFGFRFVEFNGTQLYVNDKKFYCMGFGMHEDFDLHGRGYNPVVLIRDLNMFEWMNGNCYRTSHYPYSEERAYEADRRGIMVVTEAPAVGLGYFTATMNMLHKRIMSEMIQRDFNHPSVFAWSLANEPWTEKFNARDYFRSLAIYAKKLDRTRPLTIVFGPTYPGRDHSRVTDFIDFIGLNHYDGWYQNLDHPEVVEEQMYELVVGWNRNFTGKPLIIMEYGGEGIPGMYQQPGSPFTEQYQTELIKANHKAFDRLREEERITGEMIWNFADFMTAADITRPLGNHKGVLTRQRQPKAAAYILQKRYGSIDVKDEL
ncbi:unnamed protein product [Bursaphelenchus xylophilus]|uniref:Beta-glucuronidase n=1 Tax=Bursaphelenchus xylophilus TaxID=6326 RepID=A0A1I7RXK9_BURXY|nr:unnamed protein product [Bursaphelenchus xylophilus]CAG9126541.1 unnamed protein product [Bursaphelenchus xylophilus]